MIKIGHDYQQLHLYTLRTSLSGYVWTHPHLSEIHPTVKHVTATHMRSIDEDITEEPEHERFVLTTAGLEQVALQQLYI